jgi:hypothetical protein
VLDMNGVERTTGSSSLSDDTTDRSGKRYRCRDDVLQRLSERAMDTRNPGSCAVRDDPNIQAARRPVLKRLSIGLIPAERDERQLMSPR